MPSPLPVRSLLVAAAGVAATAALMLLAAPESHDSIRGSYALRGTASLFRGEGARAAFAQDYVGARAMLYGGDPYPLLGPAFADIGLDWDDRTRSTHPPTAFLLALPLAPLSWPAAGAVWAALMLASLVVAFRAVGLPWAISVAAVPAFLLWTPGAWSVPQITIPSLLGLALAWRFRHSPVVAGAAVGFASLPKLVAAVALVPFLWRREWGAVVGFVAVWALALVAVLAVDPAAVLDYLETNRTESRAAASRLDNASLLVVAARVGGIPLAAATAVLIGAVAWLALRRGLSWDAWAIWVWLTVALLPIVWIASIVTLAPWLVRLVWQGDAPAKALAAAALLLPVFSAQYGEDAVPAIALAVALAGVAFTVQLLRVSRPAVKPFPRPGTLG